MNKYYTSDEYTVSPHSIKFDPEMVEFNRIQTDEEYQATKASIAKFGQLTPIQSHRKHNIMLIKRSKDGTDNTNSWYSQYHIKNSASTMNTELVEVLRFDPYI